MIEGLVAEGEVGNDVLADRVVERGPVVRNEGSAGFTRATEAETPASTQYQIGPLKRYEKAQTPYQRVLAAKLLTPDPNRRR